ncbi:hypothetical protein BH11PLA1_BH11PLA1_02300 [soil metagenome]
MKKTIAALSVAALLTAAGTAGAQWSSDPLVNTPICTANGPQIQPKIVRATDGTFWVSWLDNRDGAGYDVYMQHVSAGGVPLLAADGVRVLDTSFSSTVDYDLEAAGTGAVVAHRTATAVFVGKMNSAGTLDWSSTLTTVKANNNDPKLTIMSDGSVVCAYSSALASGSTNTYLEIQRLDGATGATVWPAPVVLGEAGKRYLASDVLESDNLSVWVSNHYQNGTGFTAFRYPSYQKISSAGATLFGVTAVVNGVSATTTPIFYNTDSMNGTFYPLYQPDGAGGFYTSWYGGSISTFRQRYQHIDAGGVKQFNPEIIAANATLSGGASFSLVAGATIADDNVFMSSLFYNNSGQGQRGVVAERFDGAGNALWGAASGRVIDPLSALDKSFVQGQADATGYTVAWFGYTGATTQFVKAARLNLDATDAWTPAILEVSSNNTAKGRLTNVKDGTGIVLAWHEDRLGGTGTDIILQRITRGGLLGADPVVVTRCQPADIADDAGNPLPSAGANNGVNEGDYNAFFNTFFTNQAIGSPADIANDDGSSLPPFGPAGGTNNGVNEGDYNAFFNNFFNGCGG